MDDPGAGEGDCQSRARVFSCGLSVHQSGDERQARQSTVFFPLKHSSIAASGIRVTL